MPKYICHSSLVLLIVLCVAGIKAAPELKAVKELPSGIKTCSENDANLNDCIKAAFQDLTPRLKEGVPELNIPPMDPFVLDKATYEFKNGIIQGHFNLKNIRVYGMSDTTVQKVDFKLKDGHMKMKMTSHIPHLLIEGNYKADMKLNEVKLVPKGFLNVTMSDITMTARSEGELYERDGHTYLRFTKLDNEPEIGDMRIYASGLTPDATLNEVILQFVNQNWRELYKTMLPDAHKTWEPLMINGANEFFAALPLELILTKN